MDSKDDVMRARRRGRSALSAAFLAALACAPRDETFLAADGRDELTLLPGTESALPGAPGESPAGGDSPSTAPSTAPPAGPAGPPDTIYDREHVTEIEVELDPADWERLRVEGIGLSEILFPQNGFRQVPEFTHFTARVKVDGVTYEDVDVRKKGYIGSLSVIRPSLKLDFERALGGRSLVAGNRRMTLNNDLQDPSHVRQCLAYGLFEQLGLPASRCSLARVSVNGVRLGTYTHVEPVAKPLLRRFFDDDEGNLYEGQEADLNAATASHLELETNEEANDRSDVQALIDTLALPDDQVLAALEQRVDLARFFDFWALETLLGHWDGYAGNSNNYFLYHDPSSGKFTFIPWGTDQTFVGDNPNDRLPYLPAVYAAGTLARRLYDLPASRARYRQRMGELLDTVWDEPALVAEAERLSALAPDSDRGDLMRVRSYLRNHGEALRAALAQPAPEWPQPEPQEPPDACQGTFGELDIRFDTVWGSIADNADVALNAAAAPGTARVDGEPFSGSFRGRAGSDGDVPNNAGLKLFADQGDGFYLFVELTQPLELFEPGYHPLHSFESLGQLGLFQPDFGAYIQLAVVGDGGIQLDRASLEPGGAVSGRVTGKINYYACLSRIKGFFPPLPALEPPVPPGEAESPAQAESPMEAEPPTEPAPSPSPAPSAEPSTAE